MPGGDSWGEDAGGGEMLGGGRFRGGDAWGRYLGEMPGGMPGGGGEMLGGGERDAGGGGGGDALLPIPSLTEHLRYALHKSKKPMSDYPR